jgi:hypothetical protein
MFKLPRLFLNEDAFNKGGRAQALRPYFQRNWNILALVTVASLTIINPSAVRAFNVSNGSFETGDFSGWETAGQTTVENSDFGTAPADGIYQAVLETLQDTTDFSGSQLETFLGLSAGELTNWGATEGSAIKQEITVNAGDVLTFSWNFLTDDPLNEQYNDFGFFSITGSSTRLGDTYSPTSLSFSRLAQETGYQPFSYTFASAGTYTLGFGVVDVDRDGGGDTSVNSALLVDNVNVESVPEPFTILGTLTALGFGAKFLSMRRSP